MSKAKFTVFAFGHLVHHDVFLLSYESVSDLQVQIILAVTNVYPHAARALFRPVQNWMFQQDDVSCNISIVQELLILS